MTEDRAARIAANEALYREVNERVGALNRSFGPGSETFRIVCECGDRVCTERIDISVDEYQEVRRDPSCFIVIPTHDEPDVEEVIREADGYWIVRKTAPTGRRIAEQSDLRS